jgi:uncharacterized membrane protein YbjE (DUF340 family)
MLFGLIFIFAPLMVGYAIPHQSMRLNRLANRSVMVLIYLMLGLLGVSFSALDDFSHQLSNVLVISSTFFISISSANLLCLPWLDKNNNISTNGNTAPSSRLIMLKDSLMLILIVAIGTAIGFALPYHWSWVTSAIEWLLFILLFCIGIQLRASGLSLREILLNINGLKVALIIVISSWVGGLIAGYFLHIPLFETLAMASGFGWYSLSGILIGKELGAVMGASSFLLELGRELVALILLPILIRRYPLTSIGYAGATAMDFTLPIIQINGGIKCVPIAIVSGFVLSLFVPLFMLLFLSLAA